MTTPDEVTTGRPRVKICCISSVAEAEMAIAAGADALGFVSAMPSGPGVVDEDQIAEMIAVVDGRAETFLLTSRVIAAEIADQVRRLRPSVVQLVDAVALDELVALRDRCGDVTIVAVVHVADDAAVATANRVAPVVDALLLDSGRPDAAVAELGGTGRVHDWSLSRRIVDRSPVPVWLAGGLSPDNAGRAVAEVAPFGLDLCSGVRTAGALDPELLASFMTAAGSEVAA